MRHVAIALSLLVMPLPAVAAPERDRAAEPAETSAGVVAEEVRFPSDPGVTLAGTLQLPPAAKKGPVPVVVFVAGNGRWTRGGFDRVVAGMLVNGIATLQYDKRGLGESTGEFVDTLTAVEADVAAAIAYLRSRPDIDSRRIALLGHSIGGAAVPEVAARDGGIAAIVIQSAPIGRRGDLFLTEMRAKLTAGGMGSAAVDAILAATRAWMEARNSKLPAATLAPLRAAVVAAIVGAGIPADQAEGWTRTLDDDLLLSMYRADTAGALAAIRAPVLIVYAGRDEYVASGLNVPAAADVLAGNPDALIVDIPGANHSFGMIGTGDNREGAPEAPVLGETIVNWLAPRLTGRR